MDRQTELPAGVCFVPPERVGDGELASNAVLRPAESGHAAPLRSRVAHRGVCRKYRKFQCAREAGAIQPVEVRPRKGSSVPPGSECCGAVGDGSREAYTAIERGGLSSHEMPVAE